MLQYYFLVAVMHGMFSLVLIADLHQARTSDFQRPHEEKSHRRACNAGGVLELTSNR